ncbi:MAG: hypothetical protein K2K36_10460 [Muribaculaceae bacterium]|nr:hypothetical protein [Muribaculaceae bacterium]
MEKLKKYLCVMLVAGVSVAMPAGFPGCRSIVEEPSHPEHAMFDVAELTVAAGETAELIVKNASAVEVLSVDDIVSVAVNGAVLNITGLTPGTTELTIRADGQILRCTIIVTGPDAPAVDDGEDDAERRAALADDAVRASVGALSMELAGPGNMFKVSSDARLVTVVSLTAGHHLELSLPVSLGMVLPGTDLNGIALTLDGSKLDISEAEAEQRTDSRVWLRLVSVSGTRCRLVLPLGL